MSTYTPEEWATMRSGGVLAPGRGVGDDEWEYSVNSGIPIRRRLDRMTPGPWERVPESPDVRVDG